jgi:hypothetical protein
MGWMSRREEGGWEREGARVQVVVAWLVIVMVPRYI